MFFMRRNLIRRQWCHVSNWFIKFFCQYNRSFAQYCTYTLAILYEHFLYTNAVVMLFLVVSNLYYCRGQIRWSLRKLEPKFKNQKCCSYLSISIFIFDGGPFYAYRVISRRPIKLPFLIEWFQTSKIEKAHQFLTHWHIKETQDFLKITKTYLVVSEK